MSWFSELTNKAEALLVKLDHETAEALQNSNLVTGNNQYSDEANAVVEDRDNSPGLHEPRDQSEKLISNNNLDSQYFSLGDKSDDQERSRRTPTKESITIPSSLQRVSSQDRLIDQHSSSKLENDDKRFEKEIIRTSQSIKNDVKLQSNKPIQFYSKSKSNFVAANAGRSGSSRERQSFNLSVDTKPLLNPNDVKASIKQSLLEYAIQHDRQYRDQDRLSNNDHDDETFDDYGYDNNSHFDSHYQSIKPSMRNHPSNSFSIELPENNSDSLSNSPKSNEIAMRILREISKKKKSTSFYLHKALNQLDNISRFIIRDRTRKRFGRARLTTANYAHRLNHYYQTYPIVKYAILGYLFLMQLLVVYVLFFYQPSGKPSELVSQVKQQESRDTQNLRDWSNKLGRNLK